MIRTPLVATLALVAALILGATPASAGGLDAVAAVFAGTTPHFEAVAADWSSKIFYSIVILDLLWTLYECIRTNSLDQLIDTLMYRVVGYALGVYLITNQVAITGALFDAMAQIGTAFALPGAGTPLTPNAIATLGWTAVDALCDAMPPNPAIGVLIAIPLFFCSIMLQLAFDVVAVEDLVIQIGVQLCIAIGSVLLGLVGTRWTRPIAGLWPKMAVAGFLLTVVIGAVVALGTLLDRQILADIAVMKAESFGSILQDLATISTASVVYLLLSVFFTGLAVFMGAQTPLTVSATIINAVSNAFAYLTGYNAGSQGANASRPDGHRDPVATIEAATHTAA